MSNNHMVPQASVTRNVKKIPPDGIEAIGLPKGWRIAKLGDAFKFTKKPKEIRYSEYNKIPFVPMDLIPLGSTSFDRFILKSNDEISSGTYFEPGDILIAKITPSFENGKQGIIEKLPTPFGIATTEVIPMKEVEGISDKYYLFYYLLRQDVRTELAGKMEGSTGRQRLSATTLASLELPLPPLPQQHTIAKVLQTVQETIQTRRVELKLERECKAALMEYLFTSGTRGEITKQTEIGKIPQSWKIVRLDDVVRESIKDGVHKTPTYFTSGIPFITAKDIIDNKVSFNHCAYISPEEHTNLNKRVNPEKGDILLTKVGSVGNVALVESNLEFSIFVQIALIKPKPNKILSDYLYYALQSEDVQKEIDNKSSQSTMQFIGTQKIALVQIPMPTMPEQFQIAHILHSYDVKIAALEQELSLLKELFNSLLEELMSGRLSTLLVMRGGGNS